MSSIDTKIKEEAKVKSTTSLHSFTLVDIPEKERQKLKLKGKL